MKNKRRLVFLILTLLWTGFIFSMSLRVGEESAEISGGVLNIMLDISSPIWENIIGPIDDEKISFLHLLIRKAAHFTEFLILGILAYSASFNIKKVKLNWLIALIYCILVALTDETLQLFVEGRAGRFTDSIIDIFGALSGIFIIFVIIKIKSHKKAVIE